MVLCFALTFAYVYYTRETKKVPMYTASATMYVTSSTETGYKYYYSPSDTYSAVQLIKTCGEVVVSNKVLADVSEKLKEWDSPAQTLSIGGLKSSMVISSLNETEIMIIKATTSDPKASQDICNAVLEIVPEALKEIIQVGAANVVDAAQKPTSSSNNPSYRDPAIYGILSAAVAAAIIFFINLLDTRIKSKEEITAQYGIPVLGDIPNFSSKTNERYYSYYEQKEKEKS